MPRLLNTNNGNPLLIPSSSSAASSRANDPQAQRRARSRQRYPRASWNSATPYRLFFIKLRERPCPSHGLHGVPRSLLPRAPLEHRRSTSALVCVPGTTLRNHWTWSIARSRVLKHRPHESHEASAMSFETHRRLPCFLASWLRKPSIEEHDRLHIAQTALSHSCTCSGMVETSLGTKTSIQHPNNKLPRHNPL